MNLAQLTDEEIVVMVRENDKEKYSEIIRRYSLKLTHYLRKFFRDQAELEDVLQEVFIKTYRNLFAFDKDKKFSSWIYRIAHNEAINQIKKNKKNLSLDEHEFEIVDLKADLNSKMDQTILRQKINDIFSKMKEKYREPLILYFFEEKSYDEISEILRIPRNTVGVLIMRGKKILKDYLEEK